MNTVDCVVTKVLGKPENKYGKWFVKVQYDSWGHLSETEVLFDTQNEANDIQPGYKFLA